MLLEWQRRDKQSWSVWKRKMILSTLAKMIKTNDIYDLIFVSLLLQMNNNQNEFLLYVSIKSVKNISNQK